MGAGRASGTLACPCPLLRRFTVRAFSDVWHDLFQMLCMMSFCACCKVAFGGCHLLLHSGWEATCWEAPWLGSHLKHFGWEATCLLGSNLAGKPLACWEAPQGWEAILLCTCFRVVTHQVPWRALAPAVASDGQGSQ